ncbi:MAG: hypothetical protein ABJC39_06725, partial [Chloroflexota bacterium]
MWLQEQDREAYIHQRGLERLAREGGEHRPGEDRGGINFAKKVRAAISALTGAFSGGSTGTPSLTGSTSA